MANLKKLFTCSSLINNDNPIYVTIFICVLSWVVSGLCVEDRVYNIHEYFIVGFCLFLNHLVLFLFYFVLKEYNEILESTTYYIIVFAYTVFQLIFLNIPYIIINSVPLSIIPRFLLLLETTRLSMKLHSFSKHVTTKSSTNDYKFPSFKNFLYFLIAPILIYRDNFPVSNRKIRIGFIITKSSEIVIGYFLYKRIFEYSIVNTFSSYGTVQFNVYKFLLDILYMVFPTMIGFFTGFYIMFHSWLNITSEILRFDHRDFYSDWWNSLTFSEFYRKWNIPVQNWLYENIYYDCKQNLFSRDKKGKLYSIGMVFVVSVLCHEQIITLALGFFSPIMLLFFGIIGAPISILLKKSYINHSIIICLIIGMSIMLSLYSAEYFVRQNCQNLSKGYFNIIKNC